MDKPTDERASEGMPPSLDNNVQRPLLDAIMNSMVAESDRGAVVIALAAVDTYMTELFKRSAPIDMPAKVLRNLLSHSGALGTLAAKSDIALATSLINRSFYDAITLLRKIRNDAAHSIGAFSLDSYGERLRAVYAWSSDEGFPIKEVASGIVRDNFAQQVLSEWEKRANPAFDVFGRPYSNADEVHEFAAKHAPDIKRRLDEQTGRYELALATTFLCEILLVWTRYYHLHRRQ